MITHYQNTERPQPLLKNHPSEIPLTLRWLFLNFWGWKSANSWIQVMACWMSMTIDLYIITTFFPPNYSMSWFFIFSVFTPIEIGGEVLLSRVPQELAAGPGLSWLFISLPDQGLLALPRSPQLNYWGRQVAPSTSRADIQHPTGLSEGHKRAWPEALGSSFSEEACKGQYCIVWQTLSRP